MVDLNPQNGIVIVVAAIVLITISLGNVVEAITKIRRFFSKTDDVLPVTAQDVQIMIQKADKISCSNCEAHMKTCRGEVFQCIKDLEVSKASKDEVAEIKRLHEETNKTMMGMALKQAADSGKLDLLLERTQK